MSKVWVQYQGTDICLDLHCPCGRVSHYDGYGAYAVQCPFCEAMFDLPQSVPLQGYSGRFEAKRAAE